MDESRRPIRARVSNACDACKARKVKCDGKLPCTYCSRRQQAASCHYSPPQRRSRRSAFASSPAVPVPSTSPPPPPPAVTPSPSSAPGSDHTRTIHVASSYNPQAITRSRDRSRRDNRRERENAPVVVAAATQSPPTQTRNTVADEETEVPREARLLRDAQGKLIFIGDCAPLSFFQTVRQLVTSRVDSNAFAQHASSFSPQQQGHNRSSGLEGLQGRPTTQMNISSPSPPAIRSETVVSAVAGYSLVTRGLIDLFNHTTLAEDISLWAAAAASRSSRSEDRENDVSSAVNYLVVAIGYQSNGDDQLASKCFDYARAVALSNLGGNLTVSAIQAFILITVYMLGSCQPNGAFLFLGIAARAAHSIGIHRTEINARFGSEIHRQRDRLWKSLRVLDLFLSTSMGRPPSTSDVDCTVPYTSPDSDDPDDSLNLLNASVQIFLIAEEIVVEVYSRKKVTSQLTEGISRRLRDWSLRWLQRLKQVVTTASSTGDRSKVAGACQVLCSYYYAVILVSRPFLMFEVHKRLSNDVLRHSSSGRPSHGQVSDMSRLADACIDAASFMVEPVTQLIEKGYLQGHMPLIVSWLFASSLVLGIGLLGSFGRILEKSAQSSLRALEHFAARNDTDAAQYALLSRALLSSALEYLERKEVSERSRRTESSSRLFGLVPPFLSGHVHAQGHALNGGGGGGDDDGDVEAAAIVGGLGSGNQLVSGQAPLVQTHLSSPQSTLRTSLAATGERRRPSFAASRTSLPVTGYVPVGFNHNTPSTMNDMESAFLGLGDAWARGPDLSAVMEGQVDLSTGNGFGDMNLFQLLDGGGHIDLAPFM